MSYITEYPTFLKCVRCLQGTTDDWLTSHLNAQMIQAGEPAKDAVVIFGGQSLCLSHFKEEVKYSNSL
jgi:hypothetical protein